MSSRVDFEMVGYTRNHYFPSIRIDTQAQWEKFFKTWFDKPEDFPVPRVDLSRKSIHVLSLVSNRPSVTFLIQKIEAICKCTLCVHYIDRGDVVPAVMSASSQTFFIALDKAYNSYALEGREIESSSKGQQAASEKRELSVLRDRLSSLAGRIEEELGQSLQEGLGNQDEDAELQTEHFRSVLQALSREVSSLSAEVCREQATCEEERRKKEWHWHRDPMEVSVLGPFLM